jgi:hypothetical protein
MAPLLATPALARRCKCDEKLFVEKIIVGKVRSGF